MSPCTRLVVAVALTAAASRAWATTSDCNGATDGTPCATVCIATGTCQANVCIAATLRPDGTACSSGDACTTGDHCQAGMCTPGAAVVCPDQLPCKVGSCHPQLGCLLRDLCMPDFGTPDGGVPRGSDLAVSEDMTPVDDLSLEPNDMCFIPPGSEFYQCEGADGFYYLPFDAAVPPDLSVPFHVRGGAVGDCSLTFGAFGVAVIPWPLLVIGAALLRRRRRA